MNKIIFSLFAVGLVLSRTKMFSWLNALSRFNLLGESSAVLSGKTIEALNKARAEGDKKTENWILTSIKKGYEGVGVIFYLVPIDADNCSKPSFVLGLNKKNEAEYPGGKCEEQDEDVKSTVIREVTEETGLVLDKSRFTGGFTVFGGTTGYPSYVFLTKITLNEYVNMRSKDGTFSKFIIVNNIVDTEKVTDVVTGTEYELRKFNRKYVIPQIKDAIIAYKY